MSNRGRPTTRAKGLKNGFYLELKMKGSNKATRIMRETHGAAMLALTQFDNKIVRYLGEVKDNYWMDGDNKGSKVVQLKMTNIKFVWDFFGPDSKSLAQHHLVHLIDFVSKENILSLSSGVSTESDNYSYSFIILDSSYLEIIKSKLKPHQAFKA